jgi:hypothetical protein
MYMYVQVPQRPTVVIKYLLYVRFWNQGKGAPACEAVPEVEGGGSGQAAENKFGEVLGRYRFCTVPFHSIRRTV